MKDQELGWSWFACGTNNGTRIVGHAGTQGGFYANYISIPEKEILFVMLANFPCNREKISTQVMTWIEKENYLESSRH